MTSKDVILKQLQDSHFLFEKFIEDFSEEDARFQPCEGGTHLNWILLHLARTEDWVVSTVTSTPPQLSESIRENYGGGSTCRPDDGVTRADAWSTFQQTHERAIRLVEELPESRYEEEYPDASNMFPTVGALVSLLAVHPFWHFGQLTVNRRMLGKPAVF